MELNQAALEQLRHLNTGDGQDHLLNRLIDVYGRESPKLVDQLDVAGKIGNLKAIEIAAHTLKSSSAQLGAEDFSAICKKIEIIARENSELETLPDLIESVKFQLGLVIECLEAEKI